MNLNDLYNSCVRSTVRRLFDRDYLFEALVEYYETPTHCANVAAFLCRDLLETIDVERTAAEIAVYIRRGVELRIINELVDAGLIRRKQQDKARYFTRATFPTVDDETFDFFDVPEKGEYEHDETETALLLAAIKSAAESLKPSRRETLRLILSGLTADEIAKRNGTAAKTEQMKIYRTLENLRRILSRSFPDIQRGGGMKIYKKPRNPRGRYGNK